MGGDGWQTAAVVFGRFREPVEGTFTITGVVTTAVPDSGDRHLRLAGVLDGPGVPAVAVTVNRLFSLAQALPAVGDRLPAMIDRARPARHHRIAWPTPPNPAMRAQADKAHAERVAAAVRLGLDPSVVPAEVAAPTGIRELAEAEARRRYGQDLLPDGNRPVTVAEVDWFLTEGEAATATVTGIDYLTVPARALPSKQATIANVALRVTRADGTAYATTARFGFRDAARRDQCGRIGAVVPVRLDPGNPARVCLDSNRLPA